MKIRMYVALYTVLIKPRQFEIKCKRVADHRSVDTKKSHIVALSMYSWEIRKSRSSYVPFHAVLENSFIRRTVRLQFLSLPSGVVKDCHRAQKLAKESEQGKGGWTGTPLYDEQNPEEVARPLPPGGTEIRFAKR